MADSDGRPEVDARGEKTLGPMLTPEMLGLARDAPIAADVDDGPALDAFQVPPVEHPSGPYAILKRLLELPAFEHLKGGEAAIGFLMRSEAKIKQGRQVLGFACMPRVNGELAPVFDWLLGRLFTVTLDFLIVLDTAFYVGADDRTREALVYHELCHCAQAFDAYGSPRFHRETGRPIWAIVSHDIEEFNAVVQRYGEWKGDITDFIDAVRSYRPPGEVFF